MQREMLLKKLGVLTLVLVVSGGASPVTAEDTGGDEITETVSASEVENGGFSIAGVEDDCAPSGSSDVLEYLGQEEWTWTVGKADGRIIIDLCRTIHTTNGQWWAFAIIRTLTDPDGDTRLIITGDLGNDKTHDSTFAVPGSSISDSDPVNEVAESSGQICLGLEHAGAGISWCQPVPAETAVGAANIAAVETRDFFTKIYRCCFHLGHGVGMETSYGVEMRQESLSVDAAFTYGQTWRFVTGIFDSPYTVTVSPVAATIAAPVGPTAGFNHNCDAFRTCSFVSTSTSGVSPIASYFWEMADGSTYTTATVNHQYDQDGHYYVKLTVADAAGRSDSVTKKVSACLTGTCLVGTPEFYVDP